MAKVEIFHNVSKDDNGRHLRFFGYEGGQQVLKVFEFETGGAPLTEPIAFEEVAEGAFCLGNGIAHSRSGEYYARRLRSVGVGDLIRVDGRWLACGTGSFRFLSDSPLDITNEHRGEHGTHSWKE